MSDDKLPKQDLLLKMLNMTTVEEDTVAVVAIRRANKLLADSGWTWEKLLLGKIVVVADPFANIKAPPKPSSEAMDFDIPTTPPRPQPTVPSRPTRSAPQPKPQPTAPRPTTSLGSKPNKYTGFCYCCGNHVAHGDGVIFNPLDHNPSAPSKWMMACGPCNRGAVRIQPSPAKRNTPLHPSVDPNLQGIKPNLGDL